MIRSNTLCCIADKHHRMLLSKREKLIEPPYKSESIPSKRNSTKFTLIWITTTTIGCSGKRMKYNFVVIAVIGIFALTNAQNAGINICEDQQDYQFLTDITNCSNYYICVNKQPILQTCNNKLYFDVTSQSCVASKTNCLSCAANDLTILPFTRSCNKYIMCFAGQPVLKQCYDNLQFDTKALKCNTAQIVDCVANHCTIINNANNITYIASQNACDKYYICMNGIPWEQSCAKGLQFSSACNCCDLSSNVKCTIKSSTRAATQAAANPDSEVLIDIDCPLEGIHFYAHSKANQYYVCSHGKGAMLTCAEGLYFDAKVEACRQLENILLD